VDKCVGGVYDQEDMADAGTKSERDGQGFLATLPGTAVREGELTPVHIKRRKLILTRWEGRVVAFSSECPHAAADLARGHLSRNKLTCPEHDYCFDIRNGRLLSPEDEYYRLRMFEVKEEGGTIHIRLSG
jgi:nitrite reductase/ring-hydroxylating ferredoxin subunit